jgi:hypothetical protein
MEVIEESVEEHLGSPLRRIQRATIDHVAIGMWAAAFMGTAVWPTHCSLDDAPDRISDLAARWGWQAREARRRAAEALRAPKATRVLRCGARGEKYLPPMPIGCAQSLRRAEHSTHRFTVPGRLRR